MREKEGEGEEEEREREIKELWWSLPGWSRQYLFSLYIHTYIFWIYILGICILLLLDCPHGMEVIIPVIFSASQFRLVYDWTFLCDFWPSFCFLLFSFLYQIIYVKYIPQKKLCKKYYYHYAVFVLFSLFIFFNDFFYFKN